MPEMRSGRCTGRGLSPAGVGGRQARGWRRNLAGSDMPHRPRSPRGPGSWRGLRGGDCYQNCMSSRSTKTDKGSGKGERLSKRTGLCAALSRRGAGRGIEPVAGRAGRWGRAGVAPVLLAGSLTSCSRPCTVRAWRCLSKFLARPQKLRPFGRGLSWAPAHRLRPAASGPRPRLRPAARLQRGLRPAPPAQRCGPKPTGRGSATTQLCSLPLRRFECRWACMGTAPGPRLARRCWP